MFENLSHTHNSAGAFCREGGTNTSYSLCRSIGAMSKRPPQAERQKMGTRLSRLIVIIQNKNHESEARLLKNTIARTAYELAAVLLKACARLRPSTSAYYSSKKDLTRFRTQAYADECELLWLFSCAEVSSHFSMIVCANKFFHCMTFYCLSFVAYGDNLNYA